MSDKLRFGEILVRANVLDRHALERVLQETDGQPVDLGEVLVARQLVDEDTMLQTISKALNLPRINLDKVQPDPRALALVPRELCIEHFLLPVEVERSRTGEHLHVAMANPSDVQGIKRVTRHARLRIRPLVAAARAIRGSIQRHYGGAPVPGPEPTPASGPLPQVQRPATSQAPAASQAAPPRPDPSGGSDMFDFGVTDLSSFADEAPALDLAGDDGGDDSTLTGSPVFDLARGGDPLGIDAAGDLDFGRSAVAAPRSPPSSRSPLPERPPIPTLPPLAPASLSSSHRPSAPAPRRPARPSLSPDLMSVLDTSAQQALVGAGDLGPTPPPAHATTERDGYGLVKRAPRRPTDRDDGPPPTLTVPSGGLPKLPPRPPSLMPSGTAQKPLPPLPPGLRRPSSAAAPALEASRAAPLTEALDPFATPEPEAPLAPPPAPEPLPPPGTVDDREERLDLRGLLDRFVNDLDAVDGQADELIIRYLDRYGQAATPPAGDEFFAALDRTLGHTRSGMGRLVVALIRQLARRGLVDPDALLSDLRDE